MNDTDVNPETAIHRKRFGHGFSYCIVAIILLIAGFSFMMSEGVAIGTVRVEGNRYLSAAEVLEIAGVPDKINVLRLDKSTIASRLGMDLRISDVVVYRQLPAEMVIQVQERTPLAYIPCDFGFVEVDKEGLILTAYKSLNKMDVPIITGMVMHSSYVGDNISDKTVKEILHYLSYLDDEALQNLSEVNMEQPDKLIAYTKSSVKIRIGTTERLEEKAALTKDFINELKTAKLPIEYIDLNFASPFIKFKQK